MSKKDILSLIVINFIDIIIDRLSIVNYIDKSIPAAPLLIKRTSAGFFILGGCWYAL